jgi:N6-adenosine-specific RNA methylase IME4
MGEIIYSSPEHDRFLFLLIYWFCVKKYVFFNLIKFLAWFKTIQKGQLIMQNLTSKSLHNKKSKCYLQIIIVRVFRINNQNPLDFSRGMNASTS